MHAKPGSLSPSRRMVGNPVLRSVAMWAGVVLEPTAELASSARTVSA